MYKIYIKLKHTTIGAIISTVHTSTLQVAYVINGSQHSTAVQKVPFDSFTPLQLCTKVTGFVLHYFPVIPSRWSLVDQNI
jgi:hypothetical protein